MRKTLKVVLLIDALILIVGLLFVLASSDQWAQFATMLFLLVICGPLSLYALGLSFAISAKESVKPSAPNNKHAMSAGKLLANTIGLFLFPTAIFYLSTWDEASEWIRVISFAAFGLAGMILIYMIAKNLKRS